MAEKTVPVNPRETDPKALRADIADTRRRLGQTLDVVQERLSPHYLKAQAIKTMKHRTREAGDRVSRSVRNNPWPLLATGASVAWMIGSFARSGGKEKHPSQPAEPQRTLMHPDQEQAASPTEPQQASMTDKARQQGERASQQAREASQRAAQRASKMGQQISERASHMSGQVRQQSQQAWDSAQSTFKTHPLTVGLATLATGLIAGMLIPASRKEQQWMGSTSRELMEDAKEYGQEIVERGKHVAERTYETAKEEAKQEAQSETQDFKQEVQGGGEQQAP